MIIEIIPDYLAIVLMSLFASVIWSFVIRPRLKVDDITASVIGGVFIGLSAAVIVMVVLS